MTAAVKGLQGQAPTENEQLIEWILSLIHISEPTRRS